MSPNPTDISRIEAACDAIADVMRANSSQGRYSNVRLLRSPHEIDIAGKYLPFDLVPFMIDSQPQCSDVYAFEVGDAPSSKVVVWSDHAIVANWASFEAFMAWLRDDGAFAT